MERLLSGLDVGFATLTGSTRDRGKVIRRFNEAPDCRVFLGSLKAGGTGIDLVAGSVVVTEGTFEEKISAIIDRKRRLLQAQSARLRAQASHFADLWGGIQTRIEF